MSEAGEQYHLGELADMRAPSEELTKLELHLDHDLTNLLPAGREGGA